MTQFFSSKPQARSIESRTPTIRRLQSADRGNRLLRSALTLLVCFCCLACPRILIAQSNIKIEGHVYDQDDGHPIPKAIFTLANTSFESESDNSGRFFFENIPLGTYQLSASAPGYEEEEIAPVVVAEDITTFVDIRLKRKTYFIRGFEVVADKASVGTESIQTIGRVEIEKMQAQSISEVIDNVAGVFVEKSGGGGGAHRVSIRGSAPEHVLVLVDGQKINPSGSGVADLNTISLDMVEKIEILKGGQSAVHGADALAGVINIVTVPPKNAVSPKLTAGGHWGKWSTEVYSSSFHTSLWDKLNLKISGNHEYSKNDFDIWVYGDPQKRAVLNQQGRNGDSTTNRKNAYRKADNLFVAGNWDVSSATQMSFSGHLYQAQNGIPGSYGWMVANQRAWVKDERRLARLRLVNRFSRILLLESSFGFSRFKQHFQNDTINVFDSKYKEDIMDLSLLAQLQVHPTNKLKMGAQFQQDAMDHQNVRNPDQSMGKVKRSTFGVFFSDQQKFDLPRLLLFDHLTMFLALRWDESKHLKDFISPQVGLTLSEGMEYQINLRANYGKSYRQPSNNALFWKGDVFAEGNPDLLPEKSEHSEAGGEIRLPWFGELSGGMTYFHNVVKDLIEWHRRFDGKYYPVNVSRAKIYGHEDFVRWSSPKDILQVSYNNTVCYAKNRSGDRLEDGKFIPFRPRYVTNLSFGFDYGMFEILYKIRWVSERFTGPANTKKEEPYNLQDLTLGIKRKLSHLDLKLGIEWKNLNDEEYVLIYRHPMPGREWGVSLNACWQFGKQ